MEGIAVPVVVGVIEDKNLNRCFSFGLDVT